MNVRHPYGVLHLFSIKSIYDKMDLRLFYFRVTTFWRNEKLCWKVNNQNYFRIFGHLNQAQKLSLNVHFVYAMFMKIQIGASNKPFAS